MTLLTKLPPLWDCDVDEPDLCRPKGKRVQERLVRRHHGFIELLEEAIVLFRATLLGKAQRLDAVNDGLCHHRLSLEDGHGFGYEVLKRHSSLVGRLSSSHQPGADVRRDDFDHLYLRGPQLVTKCLAVGMNCSLRSAIGWSDGHR